MDVIDYLLKPIPFERFLKAVNKSYDYFKLLKGTATVEPEATTRNNSPKDAKVKEGKKLVQICIEDIIMVKALKDYMEIFLRDHKVIVHITMSKLEEILVPPQFIRMNRSCIVKRTSIRSIQNLQLETELKLDERIVIGNTYWDMLKTVFKEQF